MIAKAITRKTKGQGFGGLARYVGNEKKMAAVAGGWGLTAAYIADAGHAGAKVAPGSIRLTNCASETLAEAIEEIELTQQCCRTGKADRTYHLVISFPPGEVPDREQLEDMEDELVAAIGLGQHQRMSAVHTDKDHLHIHVAINKVNPESYRNISPSFDKRKLMAACERLEIRHGLTRTHGELVQMPDGTKIDGRPGDMEAHSGQASLLRWTRETAKADLVAASGEGKGWQDLHAAAARHGLEVRQRGAGLVLAVVGKPRLAVKASDVDRSLSAKALTDRLGPFEPAAREQAQAAQEAAGYDRKPNGRSAEVDELVARFREQREENQKVRAETLDEIKQRHTGYRADIRAQAEERRQRNRAFGSTPRRREYDREQRHERMRQSIEQAAREREEARKRTQIPNWYGFLQDEAAAGNEKALKLLRQVETRRREIAMNLLHAVDLTEGRAIVLKGIDKQVGKDGTVHYRTRDGGAVQDRKHGVGVSEVTASSAMLALIVAQERFDRPLKIQGTDAFRKAVATAAATPGIEVRFEDSEMEEMRAQAARERQEAHARGADKPTILIIPFKDKEEARKRGAEWDSERKTWFVPAGIDPERLGLEQWVPGNGRVSDRRTYLDVPASERSEARTAGVSWDNERKAWFVPPGYDLREVKRWMPEEPKAQAVVRPPLPAIEAYVAGRNEMGAVMSASKAYRVWREEDAGEGVSRGRVSLPNGSPALLVETDDTILVIALSAEQAAATSTPESGQELQITRDGVRDVQDIHRRRGR